MKLNNKGFALTSIIYMLIVLFLMIMLLILANLASRKVVLDRLKNDVKIKLGQGGIAQGKVTARELYYEGNYTQCRNIQCTIDELNKKLDPNSESPIDTPEEEPNNAITLKVGDLVEMTPTLASYVTDRNKTGNMGSQKIKPQELKLWRVIRVNSNGTCDAVSEYVSSTKVLFGRNTSSDEGAIAYKNFVGYLNVLASKYENSNYTVGSRYMGYNGQTQIISDTSYFDGTSTKVTSEWTKSTGSSTPSTEPKGGGDSLYTTDLNLVKAAYGGTSDSYAVAYTMGTDGNPTTTAGAYWLASRNYVVTVYTNSTTRYNFKGRFIETYGRVSDREFREYNTSWMSYSSDNYGYYIRPIIVLKADLHGEGDGTAEHPYILQ